MPKSADLTRLQEEYEYRDCRTQGSNIYSLFKSSYLFMITQRHRKVLSLLDKHGFGPLTDYRILEIGCGRGRVLLDYLSYGAAPDRLHGVDLIHRRVRAAHDTLPHLPLICADGQRLPYKDEYFHLVLQYTAISSVLDEDVRAEMAMEMQRVLRKPEGMILWYDFWLNPTNPHARGIRRPEVRKLFPGCQFEFRRITLAPPIARRLVALSWMLAELAESLSIFNTHELAVVRPALHRSL